MDITILSLLIISFSFIISFIYYEYLTYWKKRNIPNLRTFKKFLDIFLFKKCVAIAFDEIYNDPITKNEPIVGIHVFHRPAIVIRHPDLIKKVLIKDFNYFQDRFSSADQHKDLLGRNNLFLTKNPQWKFLRTYLTPVFTSSKIKQMFILMNNIADELDKHISNFTNNPSHMSEQEVKKISQLFTIDVIASIAFGIDAHSLLNPEADFLKHGQAVFNYTRYRSFELSTIFFLPDIISLFNVKLFTKNATNFFWKSFTHIMNEREKMNIERNDLIQTLLALKKQSQNDPNMKLKDATLISQAATFFIAGFETSSTTMSFALWELARNPHIQKRLRDEIRNVLKKNNGELTYDVIQNMEYLNMVMSETLRLYPILPFLDRIYSHSEGKDYSLDPVHTSSIRSGTPIFIPIFSLHRDPKYFKNPEIFDPERFSAENKDKIIPYTYLPFGNGPRNCIGERFGLLQAKLGLVYFLKNHRIEMSENTSKDLVLEKKALFLQAESGVFCNLVRDPLYF